MQIKSTGGIGSGGLDLTSRLEELAQKARDKAATIKTSEQTETTETQNTAAATNQELDFSNAQERSAFLNSLQSDGQSAGAQSGEMLSQHALDPERVAQLLGL